MDMNNIIDHLEVQFDNAAAHYLCEHFADLEYGNVEDFISDLEMSSCVNGSFGGDMIYTNRILEKLSDPDWRVAIDQAFEEYYDAAGEEYVFPDGVTLEKMVTFAVDWYAGQMASYLRGVGQFWVGVLDGGTPWETRKAFVYESDAHDYTIEAQRHYVDYEVQHSPHEVTETKYNEIMQDADDLFYLEGEVVK